MARPQADDSVGPAQPAQPGPADGGAPVPPRFALRLAFGIQVAISAGDGLVMVALASRVYLGSHASWAVAAVFLAITIPITALAPVAGLLIDRLPPRRVLVSAAVLGAAVALALTQVTAIAAVLGLATGFGVCGAVLQPGLGAIVPQLTGPMGVTRANGYLQAATWGGFTIGPLLAGALTAAGGTGLALASVAAVYALGALGLWVLPLAPRRPPAGAVGPAAPAARAGHTGPGSRAGSGDGSFVSQLGAGVRFLRADAEAGLLVLVVAVMVAFANMAVVAEVAFAQSVLGAGTTGYAALVAAWTAGMLVGTLAGGRLPQRRLALATLAGTFAAGAGVALAGAAAWLWQAVAAYALGGLANGMEVVATRSFLNHRTPADIAGRVFAVYSGALFGSASIGMAMAGWLLSSLNPRLVLFLAGGGGLVAAGAGWLLYARRHARARQSPAGSPPVA